MLLSLIVTFLGAFLTLLFMRPIAQKIGLVEAPSGCDSSNWWCVVVCWESLFLFIRVGTNAFTNTLFI